MKFEELGKGVIKRRERRIAGLFIDGTGLDRATRRINRKVDMANLVRGVTAGINPTVARYYTLIPYEDDSRQRAFLEAVDRAGLQVVVKRLPPKGITRQVSVDIEMAADIVAFALGHQMFSDLGEFKAPENKPADRYVESSRGSGTPRAMPFKRFGSEAEKAAPEPKQEAPVTPAPVQLAEKTGNELRIVTIVCPSRDLAYPVSLVKELGVDTVTADFGQFNSGDILKSSAKWIDLSDSETIWRE